MSLGAIAVSKEAGREGGPVIAARITVVGDDSYPTGGTAGFAALVAAALGIAGTLDILAVEQQSLSDHVARYDRANDKLIFQLMSTGAEVANAVNLSGITFQLLVTAR